MIEWDQRYSVEIAEIDRQHQKLFDLLNELYAAMQEGQADQVVGKVLDRVVDYTVLHFAHEERLFTRYSYPGAAAHRDEHARLTAQAKALAERLKAGTGDVPVSTLKFLCDWLSRHILGSDKRYAAFLAQQGAH
jgi:hemerythrin